MVGFDQEFWDEHWDGADTARIVPVNPYLRELAPDLPVGTALDAGCGAGAEAIWLAENGWAVTAVDISSSAVAEGTRRAVAAGVQQQVEWAAADLTQWEPPARFDLVFSAYAHSSISQVELYRRLARWVRPGGTIFLVAHRHGTHGHHPEEATVTAQNLNDLLDPNLWDDVTVREEERDVLPQSGQMRLHDLILTATRTD
jgi:2-polyprenyl-3-methyl-5-hydroxy-6-metoxy-1,4-benzoquinol methylase